MKPDDRTRLDVALNDDEETALERLMAERRKKNPRVTVAGVVRELILEAADKIQE